MRDQSQQDGEPDVDQVESKYGEDAHVHGHPTTRPLLVDDLSCPICMSLPRDPFVTACGHTFCCSCLTTHLNARSTCPSCSNYLIKDNTFPNFMLSKVGALSPFGVFFFKRIV